MIEVNLHPDRGRKRRAGRGGLSFTLPASIRNLKGGDGNGGRDIWGTIAIVLPLLTLLVVGWMWFSQRSDRSALEERLAVAVDDSTRLADLRTLSDSLVARRAAIGSRLDLVQSLDEGRFVWPHLLDEVSRALPAYTWLTAMRQNSAEPQLDVQIDGLAANPLAITRFVRNLQASPYVSNVRIMGSQQQLVQNVAAQAFSLMMTYEMPPADAIRTEPLVESF